MSCGPSSCCLGLIIGFITAIVIALAAAFGVYCYFTPSAREQSREVIERQWNDIKSGGDKLIEKTGPGESGASGKTVAPEPTISVSGAGSPKRGN